MEYDIQFDKRASKELEDLPKPQQRRITEVVAKLANNPRHRGTKKLADSELYRARSGDYRILYAITNSRRLVRICAIRRRGDTTYRPTRLPQA